MSFDMMIRGCTRTLEMTGATIDTHLQHPYADTKARFTAWCAESCVFGLKALENGRHVGRLSSTRGGVAGFGRRKPAKMPTSPFETHSKAA
jgi:hypothetical protein